MTFHNNVHLAHLIVLLIVHINFRVSLHMNIHTNIYKLKKKNKNVINNNVSMKNQRNSYSRRSMSILDDYNFDKENFHPALVIPTVST